MNWDALRLRDAAAAIFIKYLLDNSVEWARAGQIPANNTVRSSEAFLAVEPQASIAPSVESAIFPPSVPGITDAFGPLEQAVSAVMAGTATDIQAALDEAEADVLAYRQPREQRVALEHHAAVGAGAGDGLAIYTTAMLFHVYLA